MRFNDHSRLNGMHAFLSASKYHWINYDDEKLDFSFSTHQKAVRGTRLHNLAADLIDLKVRMPRNGQTINSYVNDAIGFDMKPEVVLFYSINAFGTADAIGFKKKTLRISDLKTGVNRAKPQQLRVYAAFFCLEYEIRPGDIDYVLRIYQNDEIFEDDAPDMADEVAHIMDRIVTFDKRIMRLREEEEL